MTLSAELELVQLITSKWRGNLVQAIAHCIAGIDAPMNIRNTRMAAVVGNQAYLDMMRNTQEQFAVARLEDSFSPCDHSNGLALAWTNEIKSAVARGGLTGKRLRLWNGRDHLPAVVHSKVIGDWSVACFSPDAATRSGRPAQSSASHRWPAIVRID